MTDLDLGAQILSYPAVGTCALPTDQVTVGAYLLWK